jgi:hypothetical protein
MRTDQWNEIEIKDVKSFQKDRSATLIQDHVSITLHMPSAIWTALKRFIEGAHIFNKRKYDKKDGSASINQIFELILDIAHRQKSGWEIQNNKTNDEIEVAFIDFQGDEAGKMRFMIQGKTYQDVYDNLVMHLKKLESEQTK